MIKYLIIIMCLYLSSCTVNGKYESQTLHHSIGSLQEGDENGFILLKNTLLSLLNDNFENPSVGLSEFPPEFLVNQITFLQWYQENQKITLNEFRQILVDQYFKHHLTKLYPGTIVVDRIYYNLLNGGNKELFTLSPNELKELVKR